jgi:O-antigen ligase
MDSRILVFTISAVTIIISIFVGTAIGAGDYFIPALCLISLGVVALIAAPQISVFLAIALAGSGLSAPGIPGQFGLYEVACAAIIICALIYVAFTRKFGNSFTFAHKLLIGFMLLVLATGMARGFGIRFFGSDLWGGYIYVKLILASLVVFTLPTIPLSNGEWRAAIVAMGLLSLIPTIANLLVMGGFSYNIIQLFVQTGQSVAEEMSYAQNGIGVGRLTTAGMSAQFILLSVLALQPARKIFDLRSPWVGLLVGFTIILSVFSGFRLMTASLLICLFIAAWLQRMFAPKYVILGAAASLVLLATIYQVSDILPPSIQRSISWLPGIQISQVASADAAGTVSWRLELWQDAVSEIPSYFWLGKGFAFNGEALQQTVMMDPDSPQWALITGAYHNGYLSLLLLFGIGGLLLGLALLITIAIRHLKITRQRWNNPSLHRVHQAFLTFTLASLLIYLTVYGDVSAVFPQYLFFWAIMESLRKTDEKMAHNLSDSLYNSEPDDLARIE